jgi:hypothetical protein
MKSQSLLITLNVITWIVFVALLIKAGAMFFLYGYSLVKPEVAGHLYKGLDMLDLRQTSFLRYTFISLGLASLPAIQAYISHIMIRIFTKMNMESPFTIETADRLRTISLLILTLWVVSLVTNLFGGKLSLSTDPLFMAGLTYLISQIFRRGVDMQTDHELTV